MRRIGIAAVSLCMVSSGYALGQQAADGDASRCAALTAVKLEGATVTSAALRPAGGELSGVSAKFSPAIREKLPTFCRVKVTDTPTADSEIKTEVWLPVAAWNGRYRAQGNGGFSGIIDFEGMAVAVTQGYVTSGTDTGHVDRTAITGNQDDAPKFALGHPEKVKDFGWRAVHDMTVQTKELVQAFYGKAPDKAYFASCSDGGREALMEAQRFPGDYDGILAGAPANNWTALISAATEDDRTLMATPGAYVPASKLPVITAAVLSVCDGQDGLKDGVLSHPEACRFDPSVLMCKGVETDACLTAAQVATLKSIYAAKLDAQGKAVFPGYTPGAESAPGSWGVWIVGKKQGDETAMMYFGLGYFKNFVYDDPNWSLTGFDFDRDSKVALAKTGEALNATDTDLRPFAARGGKLLLYHGWNDPAIPALSTVEYYDGVVRSMGKKDGDAAVRLYMVPGMLHCEGGPGVTDFGQQRLSARSDAQHDAFLALQQWVESGVGPGTLTAREFAGGDQTKAVVRTRPVCAYPTWPKYVGGDVKDAASFACVGP